MVNEALIDMDTVAYRSAASCEPTKAKPYREDLDTAIRRADELMFRILADCETDRFVGYLSGSENFRYRLYPDYKANRKDIRRPEWLQQVREFLVSEWQAKLTDGYEADDAIGIALRDDSIVCGNDKDFRQLPGRHYNFVKLEWDRITPVQGEYNLWVQMLIGDRSDNIPGIPGLGETKAPRVLNGKDPEHWREIVSRLYESCELDFERNYRLLRLLRSEEDFEEIEDFIRQSQGTGVTEDRSTSDSPSVSQPES
jgi:5'-3' exonuclease